MKRIICLAIALMIVLSCSAFAEEFALRNGIVFGDTLEEVKEKETLPIQDSSKDETDKVWFEGTIAGMEGSVRFDFSEETGKLTDMLYAFDTKTDKGFVDSDYSTLSKSLNRKYGTPLGNTRGKLHLITGPAIEYGATIIGLYKYLIEGDGDF